MSSYKGTITLSNVFQSDITVNHVTSSALRSNTPYFSLNDGLSSTLMGLVNMYDAGVASGNVLSNFTSNTVSITTGLTIIPTRIVLLKGTPNNVNDGLYEVLTYNSISGLLTINGSPSETFSQVSFTPTTTFSGTIRVVGINLLRSTNVSNGFQIGYGNTSPLTYNTVAIVGSAPYTRTVVNTSTYTILGTEDILAITYTVTGQCTLTLPNASTPYRVTIVDEGGNAFANNITVQTPDGALIMGSSTWVMNKNYGTIRLYTSGTAWFAS